MRGPWSFQPLRSPDGGAGADAPAPAPVAADPSPAPAPVPAPAPSPAPAPATTRPDWLPEDQWDAAAGKPKADIAAALKAKSTLDERAALIPADAAGYKIELPEGSTWKPNEADPLLAAAREWAKAEGLTQAQFNGVLGLRAKMEADLTAANEAASAAELAALGAKAQDRISGATTFLKSVLPADQFEALKGAVTSAKAVEAVETLMGKVTGPVVPGSGANGGAEAVSELDYFKTLFKS